MTDDQLADEIILDLLRSAWLVESARTRLYRKWAGAQERYWVAAERTVRRGEILTASLEARGRKPDEALVERHSAWLEHLSGSECDEVAFGFFFVARVGDWIDRHVAGFLESGSDELVKLGKDERSTLEFPGSLPPAPPYAPVETIPVEPPGRVKFRFGILADLHFGSARSDVMARAAIADLNRSGAELVIQLGDITDHGDRSEFESAAKALGGLEMPFATMIGNHDVFSIEEERLSGSDYYAPSFGREPDGVILEHKGVRFAVLDSATSVASPFPGFDFASGSFVEGSGGAIVRGSLTVPQHEILAEVAAPGTPPAFVFLHHPPQPFTGFPPVLFGLRDADSGRLHATADSGNVWGVFAGHTHRNERTRTYGTVPVHEIAMPRDYPYGYALVDVTESGYAFRFVQLSDEELLRDAYTKAGEIYRRYGLGPEIARGFVWTKPQ